MKVSQIVNLCIMIPLIIASGILGAFGFIWVNEDDRAYRADLEACASDKNCDVERWKVLNQPDSRGKYVMFVLITIVLVILAVRIHFGIEEGW